MAVDAISPLSTCMALFFSLLLVSHFTMAVLEHSFSPSNSNKEGAKKRNTVVAASAREGSSSGTQNSKKDMALIGSGKGLQQQVPKKGGSRVPRPPLQWRKKRFFSASEHEVPSGPNPISNK